MTDQLANAEALADSSSNVHQVQRQLVAIFDPENLKKDNFFRELMEKDPDHWVPIKKMAMIKRFKEILGGDLSLFEKAVSLSPEDFEMNEEKTHLRPLPKTEEETVEEEKKELTEEEKKALIEERKEKRKAENQQAVLNHFEVQNKRSIYAKGFPVEEEPVEAELKAFYGKFGRVLSVRYRREGNHKEGQFKGSIFVEFETPEIAQQVVNEATEFKDLTLLTMIKADYVEMKRQEKYQNEEFTVTNMTHRHLVEYSNANEHSYTEIKDLIKTVHPTIGRLEPIDKKGNGVVELFKITPEEFLAKLDNQMIEDIKFSLATAEARSRFNKIQKESHNGRGGRGGRGGGRGGRGGKRGGGKKREGGDGRKRGNDNANNVEISNKRARITPTGIPTVGSS